MTADAAFNVLLYTHESYGLGHLKKTLALTRYLSRQRPAMRQLIVTGAAMPHPFVLPDDADYLKLPSVTKTGPDRYASRSLPESWEATWALRRDILLATVDAVRPHVLIADTLPHGHCGELVPALLHLKNTQETCLVAGLRDIVGESAWVRELWGRYGVYELLDDVYDLVLVYGQQDVHDPIAAYGFSERAAAKTRFVGYLHREPSGPVPSELRRELGLGGGPLVLVLAGGSGDERLLETAATAARLPGGGALSWLLVPGPLAPPELQRRVRVWAARAGNVHVLPYVQDAAAYMSAADAVVTLGGYSAACEFVSLAKPAVIVPDEDENREQLIRACAFEERGLARMIHPQELCAVRLLVEVADLLDGRPLTRVAPLRLDGLACVLAEIEAIVAGRGSL